MEQEMTTWQWSVIRALIRLILMERSVIDSYYATSKMKEDIELLKEVLKRND